MHFYINIYILYTVTLERDLLSEFHATLKDLKRSKPLVLLVDGVDLVRDDWDQLSSGWIPQQLAQVYFLFSLTILKCIKKNYFIFLKER